MSPQLPAATAASAVEIGHRERGRHTAPAHKGMDVPILRNPSDPDTTYREKAGKQNRRYAANVAETAGEAGGSATDY